MPESQLLNPSHTLTEPGGVWRELWESHFSNRDPEAQSTATLSVSRMLLPRRLPASPSHLRAQGSRLGLQTVHLVRGSEMGQGSMLPTPAFPPSAGPLSLPQASPWHLLGLLGLLAPQMLSWREGLTS